MFEPRGSSRAWRHAFPTATGSWVATVTPVTATTAYEVVLMRWSWMTGVSTSHTAVPTRAPASITAWIVGHSRGWVASEPATKNPIAPGNPHAATTPTTPGRTRIRASSPTSSAPPDLATSTVTSATRDQRHEPGADVARHGSRRGVPENPAAQDAGPRPVHRTDPGSRRSKARHRWVDPGDEAQEGPQVTEVQHLVEQGRRGEGAAEREQELGARHEMAHPPGLGPRRDPPEPDGGHRDERDQSRALRARLVRRAWRGSRCGPP